MRLHDDELLELIEDVLQKDTLKFPRMEKLSAAGEGLTIGLQNCDRYPLAERAYLKWQIRNKLKEEYRDYWKCRQIESSFSIDKYFKEGDMEMVAVCLPVMQSRRDLVEDIVCWRDFRSGLCADLNRLLWEIIDGYTVDEICAAECTEPFVILERLSELEAQYRFYYEL